VIAVDTNVLVYSHRRESPFHAAAQAAIESLRSGPADWAIPWPCVHEFISVVTNPKIFAPHTPIEHAFTAIENWLSAGNLHFICESDGYLQKLRQITASGRVIGGRIHDARIAAICLHHGIHELWSCDRNFSAFPTLVTRNPIPIFTN
jgi:toxin-antitoxin system PIN domain toxin